MTKQNNGSSQRAPLNQNKPTIQIEAAGETAEIIHTDGRRETVQMSVSRSWSGALPRPEDFGRYGHVVPDAPKRLLRMLEREQQHRITMEQALLPAEIRAGKRGQAYGAAISRLPPWVLRPLPVFWARPGRSV
ncbi:MAG: DUF2335 domain-containing protein [Paracoccus sp. (in: a-proteobacteria)]|nr:DUF2335 domain-containing protein [Paracoccus sp. (in: a-proteobacteria)]